MYPLVRELAVDGIPAKVTFQVLGCSNKPFVNGCNGVFGSYWDDAHLIKAILDVHGDDPEFGFEFIGDEPIRAGWDACENRVQRLRQQRQIW